MTGKYTLTIGIPTCYDFSGCVATVRNLMDNESFDAGKIQILIIDNTPDTSYANALKGQITNMGTHVKYFRHEALEGPASSKNKVFEEAAGTYTVCADSHVHLNRGIIDRLIGFIENMPKELEDDYFTGPLLHNDGKFSTNYADVWRGQMWGIWETTNKLLEDDDLKPIWGQGCGLFMVKTDSWLGFNPNFKAFGGEEGYIHEKYRKAGKEVWLIPWLTWWHRFGNPDTKHYSLSRYGKVRNYVIGHQELNQPLDRIYNHFVNMGEWKSSQDLISHLVDEHSVPLEKIKGMGFPALQEEHKKHKLDPFQWDWLLQDPINHVVPKKDLLHELYIAQKDNKSNDLSQHYDLMLTSSKDCDIIGDISRRSLSVIPALKANPKKVISCLYEGKPLDPNIPFLKDMDVTFNNDKYNEVIKNIDTLIPKCDVLYFQYPHKCETTVEDLQKVAKNVSKRIIIRETQMKYRPEIADAMKALVKGGEWFVEQHTNQQWGTTILSRTKPEKPVIAWLPEFGPGSELKKLLSRIGIVASENCSCNQRANIMDVNGIEWCEKNIETIVDWLGEEAAKRKTPYVRLAGRTIAKLAIRRAKKLKKAK